MCYLWKILNFIILKLNKILYFNSQKFKCIILYFFIYLFDFIKFI